MKKIALIVYGSLISKNELLNEKLDIKNFCPIFLSGYKREFTQEPSYRFVNSINRAVLNVKKDTNSFLNGVLISLDKKDFEILDKREKAYTRTLVDKNDILFKYKINRFDFDEVYIYEGKKEKLNQDILPNINYLDLCIKASKTWDTEFYYDFLNTTFIKNQSLKEYLNT